MTARANAALRALLGGRSARRFLREHWQQRPLLIRAALPDFVEPLTRDEVLELASRDDAQSRLVQGARSRWTLRHGPFTKRDWRALRAGGRPWTVLVQDTQHHSHEAHALLARFNFISHARIDDLMVSYATDGGGVGPHVDSYDVFLLQGMGRRHWRISGQTDLALLEDAPLRILKRFRAEEEFILEKGDMLYLPPGVAHHGVALGECMTWSIGFRAPSHQELVHAWLDHLRDELVVPGWYTDPQLAPTAHPGAAGARMVNALRRVLRTALRTARDASMMDRALGRFLTEPKPHVCFHAPERALGARAFGRLAHRDGIALALATRLLSVAGRHYINGRELAVPEGDSRFWNALADQRRQPACALAAVGSASMRCLHELYRSGEVELPVAATRTTRTPGSAPRAAAR